MRLYITIIACFLTMFSFARDPADSTALLLEERMRFIDSVESTLHYKTGKIGLQGGLATLNIPTGYKFLEGKEAKYIIEDVWGNLESEEEPLGLIVPVHSGAITSDYAFIVTYEAMGYVKDDDADDINYDDLLKELKEGSALDNTERQKAGLYTMDLVGWASKPYYDEERKVLHWAKEYKVEGAETNTLNYDIRVLGRKGVLTLQAVAGIEALDSVNRNINTILGMVNFGDGNKYSDFDSKTDDVAAWTIGGLVAGKVLAKVGFFAIILKYIKFILLGVAAVGGSVWRWITGRKKKEEDDLAYQPVPPAQDNSPA